MSRQNQKLYCPRCDSYFRCQSFCPDCQIRLVARSDDDIVGLKSGISFQARFPEFSCNCGECSICEARRTLRRFDTFEADEVYVQLDGRRVYFRKCSACNSLLPESGADIEEVIDPNHSMFCEMCGSPVQYEGESSEASSDEEFEDASSVISTLFDQPVHDPQTIPEAEMKRKKDQQRQAILHSRICRWTC